MLVRLLGALRPRIPLLDDTGPLAQLLSWPRLQAASATGVFVAVLTDSDLVHGRPSRTTSAQTSDLLEQAIGGNLAAILLAMLLLLVFQRRLFDVVAALVGITFGAATVWLTSGPQALALYGHVLLVFYVLGWMLESLARLFLVAPLLRLGLAVVLVLALGITLNHNTTP